MDIGMKLMKRNLESLTAEQLKLYTMMKNADDKTDKPLCLGSLKKFSPDIFPALECLAENEEDYRRIVRKFFIVPILWHQEYAEMLHDIETIESKKSLIDMQIYRYS